MELAWLDNNDLKIDPKYHLRLNHRRVDEIVKNFDPALVTPIMVSYRDGKFFIVKGAHLRAALERVNRRKDFSVLCAVFFNLNREEEAFLKYTMYTNDMDPRRELRDLVGEWDGDEY